MATRLSRLGCKVVTSRPGNATLLASWRFEAEEAVSKVALNDAFAPLDEVVKPILTTSEAAKQLGISKSTLIRAVNRGQVQPAFRTPGRHLRFTVEELQEIRRSLGFAVREAS
jgi:excisionase family DNA binding protein